MVTNVNTVINKVDDLMNKVDSIISLNLSETLETILDSHKDEVLDSNDKIQTQLTEMISTTQNSNELIQTQLTAVKSTTQNLESKISTVAGQIQNVQENVAPKLYCKNELSLDDCLEKHFTRQEQLINFIMHQSVTLVGGRTKYEGRVEINSPGRQGTVCDDDWSNNDARVVCRMLGFSGGTALQGTHSTNSGSPSHSFGQGIGEILLDNLWCSGSE